MTTEVRFKSVVNKYEPEVEGSTVRTVRNRTITGFDDSRLFANNGMVVYVDDTDRATTVSVPGLYVGPGTIQSEPGIVATGEQLKAPEIVSITRLPNAVEDTDWLLDDDEIPEELAPGEI